MIRSSSRRSLIVTLRSRRTLDRRTALGEHAPGVLTMASIGNKGGQRTNTTSASGRKERSPTSTPRTGSRVDPSHTVDKARTDREKKAATPKKATTTKAAASKSAANLTKGAKKR